MESDGTAGNLILDANGNLSLNGNTTDPRFFNPTTLGTARDAITTFENINNFIIAPGQTVNVLGTLIVKSKRTQIDGTLNGNGGGYAGAVARSTDTGEFGNPGQSPLDTNGHGKGGMAVPGGGVTGGGGGSHGKLTLFCSGVLLLFLLFNFLLLLAVIKSSPWHVAGLGGRVDCSTSYTPSFILNNEDWIRANCYDSNKPFCSDLTSCPGFNSLSQYTGCCNEGGKPGDVYDDTLPLTLRPGSGGGGGAGNVDTNGGAGGAGGAAIIFYSEEIVLNGNIYANGSNGGRGASQK